MHTLLSLQTTALPATHTPLTHESPLVHTVPSASQGPPSLRGTRLQTPVAAAQVLMAQVVSPLVLQVTTVFASTTHVWLVRLQISVPSHRSPFSNGPHSALLWHWQVFPPLTQLPLAHTSPTVHTLPSSQLAVLLVCTQPLAGSQLSVVHGLLSSQVTLTSSAVPTHALPLQRSAVVQALLSLHGSLLAVCTQPLTASHESVVQPLLSLQLTALPTVHTPLTHESPLVHTVPSASQGPPSLRGTRLQTPVAAAQVLTAQVVSPPVLHVTTVTGSMTHVWLPKLQTSVPSHRSPFSDAAHSALLWHWQVFPPLTQLPLAHTSPTVQTLPSSQPAVLLLCTQPLVGSQLSVVHGLLSSQVTLTSIAVPTQALALQTSAVVHALLSLHGSLLAVCTQPLTASHESVVQPLLSLQLTALPAVHTPLTHESPLVHTVPSASQGPPSLRGTRLQTPVAAAQVLMAQVVSPLVLQVTTVFASTTHVWLVKLQISVPSHRSPFSDAAQSPLLWHWQVFPPLTQLPLAHTSPTVHRFPSSQPAVLLVCTQPLVGSQLSVVQGLLSSQVTLTSSAVPTQALPLQVSAVVQALLSLQGSLLALCTQPLTASHESVVQPLLSLQLTALPLHTVSLHASPRLQALLSSHVAKLAACTQLPPLQLSSVQTLLSSQFGPAPPTHAPAAQVSPSVHALPSSQLAVLAV